MESRKMTITSDALRRGAEAGAEALIRMLTDKYLEVTGGVINSETMPLLNDFQHALLGYRFFCEEVDEGGFVQLIQNGYGPYIFDNPFAKAMRLFGAKEFSKLVYEARNIYNRNRADLERERDEEAFMAMYEKYEAFDDLEEDFIDMREAVSARLADYVMQHVEDFTPGPPR